MAMTELNFLDLFYYVLKRVWILAATMIFCAGIAFFGCKCILTPEYTASASVYILNRSSQSELIYSDLQSSEKLTSDFEVLITGRNITSAVIEKLNLDMTDAELAGNIAVSNPNNARILQISVTDGNPKLAMEIANCILDVSAEQIVPIMGIDALNVVYEAVEPTVPSSPNTMKNTLLAAAFSGILTIAALVFKFALDDTIRTEDDVTKYLGLSTMGVVPKDTRAAKTNLRQSGKARK